MKTLTEEKLYKLLRELIQAKDGMKFATSICPQCHKIKTYTENTECKCDQE